MTEALREILRPAGPVAAAADDELIHSAALVTAELISNAVRACRQAVSVTLDMHHRFIRITVYDDGPGSPAVQAAGPTDVAGRGLRIVDSLAGRWGTQRQRSGKAVWVTLGLSTRSAEHLDCHTHASSA